MLIDGNGDGDRWGDTFLNFMMVRAQNNSGGMAMAMTKAMEMAREMVPLLFLSPLPSHC